MFLSKVATALISPLGLSLLLTALGLFLLGFQRRRLALAFLGFAWLWGVDLVAAGVQRGFAHGAGIAISNPPGEVAACGVGDRRTRRCDENAEPTAALAGTGG